MKLTRTQPVSSPSRRGAIALVVGLLLLPVALKAAAHADDSPGISKVSVFRPTGPPTYPADSYAANAHLYASLPARRLFAVSSSPTWMSIYNLDTLQQVGQGFDPGGSSTAVVPDLAEPIVFVGRLSSTQGVFLDEYASRPTGPSRANSLDLTPFLAGREIIGFYRLPGQDVGWVLSSTFRGDGVAVSEVTLGLGQVPMSHRWTQPLPRCTFAMHSQQFVAAALGYLPDSSGGWLYLGCGAQSAGLTGPPIPRGAARLRLDGNPISGPTTAGATEVFTHAGDFTTAVSLYDPGSGRLVMSAYSSSTAGSTVYVFDTKTNSYVGGVTGGSVRLDDTGLDPTSGRFYAMSAQASTGLIAADIRPTPASQGVNIPDFATFKGAQPDIGSHIAVDPVQGRIFLKYTNGDFVVARDTIPRWAPGAEEDPDANTVDMTEAPGLTEANFGAATQGFGSRVRQIGGVGAAVVNYVGVDSGTTAIGPGTREFEGAYLTRLQMTNDEAAAAAIGADVDDQNTKSDVDKAEFPPPPDGTPSSVPRPPSDPLVNWPYQEARCAEFDDGSHEDVQTDARVTCLAGPHLARASALQRPMTTTAGVIGESSFESQVSLEKKQGSVATITAVSRGIDLLNGQLTIGEVSVATTVSAHGRPGTATGTFVRTVKDVAIGGKKLCDVCDPQAVADAINSQLTGFIDVQFPLPDPAYLHGTKGGYEAMVRQLPATQLTNVLLNEQPSDRQEVPGAVIVVSEDGFRPGRTVIELAGTAAEAHYGIVPVEGIGSSSGDETPAEIAASLGDGGANVGGPVFGLPDAPTPGPTERIGHLAPLSRGGGLVTATRRLLFNGARAMGALLPIWFLLLIPVYLSARRWLLLQRSSLMS